MLVGAPSISFNGYFYFELAPPGDVPEPAPSSTADAEILRYILGDEARRSEFHPQRTTTHDLYWGNFIYSAVKLIETGLARPERGDILTIMIYVPGYAHRALVDWEASPYNTELHGRTTWVGGQVPYDRRRLAELQGRWRPFYRPERPDPGPATPGPPSRSEPDINHEILTRTTTDTDPDGGFHKRPRSYNDYESAISDIPRRLVLGSRFGTYPPVTRHVPLMPEVQVKLLLMSNPSEFIDYVKLGRWRAGPRWLHLMDITEERDMGQLRRMSECSWSSYALTKRGRRYRDWESEPSVDRTRVKIKRLDYFGHSGNWRAPDGQPEDAIFLQYGCTNGKGQLSRSEQVLGTHELGSNLSRQLFARDSFAQLWGCSLGRFMAPMLVNYIDVVVACPSLTTYNFILNDGVKMPEPANPVESPFIVY